MFVEHGGFSQAHSRDQLTQVAYSEVVTISTSDSLGCFPKCALASHHSVQVRALGSKGFVVANLVVESSGNATFLAACRGMDALALFL